MNKKTRLYIDTSVWNFALEAERNEYGLTNNFLGFYGKNKNYQLVTSYPKILVYVEKNFVKENPELIDELISNSVFLRI